MSLVVMSHHGVFQTATTGTTLPVTYMNMRVYSFGLVRR